MRIDTKRQEQWKREFFQKLKANLAGADADRDDELVDEFRSLLLSGGGELTEAGGTPVWDK